MSNFVELVEIREESSTVFSTRHLDERATSTSLQRVYTLRKVVVNADHISLLKENGVLEEKFQKDKIAFPKELDERQRFTTVQFNSSRLGSSSTIDVIGPLDLVVAKLSSAT